MGDSCGMAGGTPAAGEESTVEWIVGQEVTVAWTIQANHGGGYQYRLCPKGEPLTEECFQQMPLPFTGLQGFHWGDGVQVYFNGTYVTEGTVPKGSAWAMNPIPRNDTSNSGQSFPPRCEEVPDCGSTLVNSKCLCSGMWGPYGLQIIDTLQVPHLPQGDYVLGWRWDCEESTQVWASCSDITITA